VVVFYGFGYFFQQGFRSFMLLSIGKAIKQRNPDAGALLAAPQLGWAPTAPAVDMFNRRRKQLAPVRVHVPAGL
jgi:hypothetical protein